LLPNFSQIILFTLSAFLVSPYKKSNIEIDENENKKFPYKLAKIVEGKKRYIEFWIWSNEENKLVRNRIFQQD